MILAGGLPDVIASNPLLLAGLLVAVALVVAYQRTLSWPEYRRLHAVKLRVLPWVDRLTSLFVVSNKGYRDDAEYVATVPRDSRETFRVLVDGGGSPHLVNSVKRRTRPDGTTDWSRVHVVWIHDDGSQTEAYAFANGDGSTDVYAHHETSVLDPEGHLSDGQRDGDPRGVVRAALDGAE